MNMALNSFAGIENAHLEVDHEFVAQIRLSSRWQSNLRLSHEYKTIKIDTRTYHCYNDL